MKVNIEKNLCRSINFDDAKQKAAFVAHVSHLQGVFDVRVTARKRVRTNPQNRYYWGVVVSHVAAGLAEMWGEVLTPDETHIMLKQMFLARPIVNRTTGEVSGHVYPSSAKLTIDGFSQYIEQISKFAAESLGVVIPSAAESY